MSWWDEPVFSARDLLIMIVATTIGRVVVGVLL